jgi:hypothetical protein
MVARVRGKQILSTVIYHDILLERSPLGALILRSAQYTETLAQGLTTPDDRLTIPVQSADANCHTLLLFDMYRTCRHARPRYIRRMMEE